MAEDIETLVVSWGAKLKDFIINYSINESDSTYSSALPYEIELGASYQFELTQEGDIYKLEPITE